MGFRNGGGGKRRDAIEPAVIRALHAIGVQTWQINGKALPDLLCLHRDRWVPLGVKSGEKARLTPSEREKPPSWPMAHSVDEALAVFSGRLPMIADALQRLRAYVRHRPECAAWTNESHPAEWRERDAAICNCGLSAVLAALRETPQEPQDVDVQLLAWAVSNCHTLARRRLRAGSADSEWWGHVLRICEKAGAQSQGVLRASVPTEITDGSAARAPHPERTNESARALVQSWIEEDAKLPPEDMPTDLAEARAPQEPPARLWQLVETLGASAVAEFQQMSRELREQKPCVICRWPRPMDNEHNICECCGFQEGYDSPEIYKWDGEWWASKLPSPHLDNERKPEILLRLERELREAQEARPAPPLDWQPLIVRIDTWLAGYHSAVNSRGWQNQPAIPIELMESIRAMLPDPPAAVPQAAQE